MANPNVYPRYAIWSDLANQYIWQKENIYPVGKCKFCSNQCDVESWICESIECVKTFEFKIQRKKIKKIVINEITWYCPIGKCTSCGTLCCDRPYCSRECLDDLIIGYIRKKGLFKKIEILNYSGVH